MCRRGGLRGLIRFGLCGGIRELLAAGAGIAELKLFLSRRCCALRVEHRHVPGVPRIKQVTRMRLWRPEYFVHHEALGALSIKNESASQHVARIGLPGPQLLACGGDMENEWMVPRVRSPRSYPHGTREWLYPALLWNNPGRAVAAHICPLIR